MDSILFLFYRKFLWREREIARDKDDIRKGIIFRINSTRNAIYEW